MQIKNIEGYNIPTLNFDYSESFIEPSIFYDYFSEREVIPDIKVFSDINILSEIDFNLYSIELEANERWAPRQRAMFFLRQKNAPVEDYAKKLNKLPINHFIEVDIANRRVRLFGKFVERGKDCSIWMDY